ncbi:DUF7344 domain-containing protein [Halopelagius longus]|uniref:DUF7344 domain-containing protein n=1 Tax=Halopelagius longus TaxID=1236180 RepID=A0A1H1DNL0_9EURY|nr:hypothetical protein [Halopelagius longus]RDI71407.1 hypothetical protein DWB78_06520 [Halopelagius longus]SDQ78095.1 hypothetical protein SAMN05216278_2502 [Halopelagius longus]
MAVKQDGIPSGRSTTDSLAVLDDKHRLTVVGILAAEDRSVTLSDLAEGVAGELRGVEQGKIPEQDIERAEITLHHNHLPKLDDAGVLEYSPEDHRVVPTDDLKTAATLTKTVDTN